MEEEAVKLRIEELRSLLLHHRLIAGDNDVYHGIGFSAGTVFDLFVSKVTTYAIHEDEFVDSWIADKLMNVRMEAEIIPIDEIDRWLIDRNTQNIYHASGRFFSIIGLRVRHRMRYGEISWEQPIIEQPEVGILGLLATRFGGVLHFCLQAKVEPGNINSVQLAPTVQATYSNYTQVHGGKPPLFLDLFVDPPADKILFSKLQPEDGGRFLFKSNKNMIILVGCQEVSVPQDDYIWLTLRQISNLMKRSNLINSCARSVLSCLI